MYIAGGKENAAEKIGANKSNPSALHCNNRMDDFRTSQKLARLLITGLSPE